MLAPTILPKQLFQHKKVQSRQSTGIEKDTARMTGAQNNSSAIEPGRSIVHIAPTTMLIDRLID